MQCNIDGRGRLARLISGLICLAAAVALIVLAVVGFKPFWAFMGSGLGLIAVGAFQVFEARTGWCVMRALGFKTPM